MRFEERNPQQRNRRKLVALWSDVHGERPPKRRRLEVGFEETTPWSPPSPFRARKQVGDLRETV